MQYSEVKEKLLSLFDRKKLMVMPKEWEFFNEHDRSIKRIGYVVNLTPEIIEKAHQLRVDFLITHHPSISELKDECYKMLEVYDIIHTFFHAPLDDADFGNSRSIAVALGLINCKKIIPYQYDYYWGITGELVEKTTYEKLLNKLSMILNETVKGYKNNDTLIHKVCINAGGGDDINKLKEALDHQCDVYITGGYNLDFQLYAKYRGINLMIGSHTNTELMGIQNFANLLTSHTGVEATKIDESNY
ncbi:SMS protein [Anaerocolumna sedimenticola]|uniref:GTP cyclohydrolase 1 type 2 homolog n=1 Tax=Anaerocolumna sedimenticola TaxID=2696063 RepID=A0A6P1TP70_9FIRM|nr:Nif3-like dinuclear metal center hexameric protein [Anaerocolumna sedimenticola]QHQ61982.1 SMS protein [Anaerocolumna sedimenticola]